MRASGPFLGQGTFTTPAARFDLHVVLGLATVTTCQTYGITVTRMCPWARLAARTHRHVTSPAIGLG